MLEKFLTWLNTPKTSFIGYVLRALLAAAFAIGVALLPRRWREPLVARLKQYKMEQDAHRDTMRDELSLALEKLKSQGLIDEAGAEALMDIEKWAIYK